MISAWVDCINPVCYNKNDVTIQLRITGWIYLFLTRDSHSKMNNKEKINE